MSDIRREIETSYKATAKVDEAVKAFETLAVERVVEDTPKAVVDENAPIVQVVNLILEQAVRDRVPPTCTSSRSTIASGCASASTVRCTRC